ncbi:MAG: WD40 repeat domain-containing protein, partial [Planctomycetota bacterium]
HVQVYRRSDGSPVFASPPKLPSLYNDALAIDDAGKWLAIGDNAGHLTMFSLQNPGQAPRTFKASSPIVDLVIEPTTDRIVVATGDRRVQLVSLQTGRRLTRTFEHPRLIQGLRISPDGQALAVFGGERLRLHSLSTGEPLSSLLRCAPDLIQIRWENRRDPDYAIPLGQRDIVRGVSGGLNRLRTLHRDQASNQTIQQSWRLPIWKENVVRLPDATRPLHLQAIRGSDQTSVSIIVHAVEKPDSVEPIRLGDDLESDAGGDSYEDRRVVRYRLDRVSNSSLPTEAIRDRPEALKSDAFRSVQYNRSGKSVVHTTTNNGTDKFTLDCRLLQASFQGVSHVHLSDDDRLSIGGFSGQVQIIDPAHPESALKLPHPHWTTVSIPFDRRHWLSGCWDGGVRMWRAQTDAGDLPSGTQQPVGKYDHRSVISDLAVSGDLVFSADWNGRLRCERWSGSRFEAIASQSHDGGKIVGLKAAATNDDHRIASFGDDNTVRLWDGRLNELATIRLANQVQTIAFSSDGSLLAVLQTDGNLSIYTGRKGKLLYPQISAGTGITTASWEGRRLWLGGTSPDGAWVAHLDPP